MDGQGYYIVTGATGSIGRAICRQLLSEGKSVIATYRNAHRKEQLLDELCRSISGRATIECELLELDKQASIRDFCNRISGTRIHALINNAGAMNRYYRLTNDGLEHTMAVNFFGTVLLTRLLLPHIEPTGCIIFTTSVTRRLHRLTAELPFPTEKNFSQLGTYGRSKLALTHYAMHLADELQGQHIRVNCADPGVVDSGMITMHRWFDPLADLFFRPFISSPERGAESALQAIVSPLTGMIFHHSRFHAIGRELRHNDAHRQLISTTDNLLLPSITPDNLDHT